MPQFEHFELKCVFFSQSFELVNVNKEEGFADISGCCFDRISSNTSSSIFLIQFDRGSLLFDNSIIKGCRSASGSQTFEFISQSDVSFSTLSRLSYCCCGYFGTAAYSHSAVSRSTTTLCHCNSSNNIANREAGLYIIYQQSSHSIKFFHLDSIIADGDTVVSSYGIQSNYSYTNVNNCTSYGADVYCILLFPGNSIVEKSNFVGNQARQLFWAEKSKEVVIRYCYSFGLNGSNSTDIIIEWCQSSNVFIIASPVLHSTSRECRKHKISILMIGVKFLILT